MTKDELRMHAATGLSLYNAAVNADYKLRALLNASPTPDHPSRVMLAYQEQVDAWNKLATHYKEEPLYVY